MDDGSLADLRRDYGDSPLHRRDLPAEPLALLQAWLAAAASAGANEPNAMALATAGEDGEPNCRVVLLKTFEAGGLTFFTNRHSQKGRELAQRPRAAATFWWHLPRDRQVRVAGRVVPAADELSDRYFASRPREAQLCSAASPQSEVVGSRDELQARVDALAAAIGHGAVPRPPHWGGYTLLPDRFEFWQGRAARLHDRFRYRRVGAAVAPASDAAAAGGWIIERLAP